jgi:hypothetical protein
MEILASAVNPDYLMIAGGAGIFLGVLFLLLFCYRRIRWLILLLARKRPESPGLLASLRNTILIVLWGALFGMVLFLGFFLRTYHAFSYEKPVAEIVAQPLGETGQGRVALLRYASLQSPKERYFLVRGDQWMIEGDILKWEDWLNFVGLHTRYRLTRLRGRFVSTEMEKKHPPTILSLVDRETHPVWGYLYRYGHELPLVNTVYGSAAFQLSDAEKRYLVYVSTAGFVVREDSGE